MELVAMNESHTFVCSDLRLKIKRPESGKMRQNMYSCKGVVFKRQDNSNQFLII